MAQYGSNEKVMCVPMDYAKKDHLVMSVADTVIFYENRFP
jgi:hypothetical protein